MLAIQRQRTDTFKVVRVIECVEASLSGEKLFERHCLINTNRKVGKLEVR